MCTGVGITTTTTNTTTNTAGIIIIIIMINVSAFIERFTKINHLCLQMKTNFNRVEPVSTADYEDNTYTTK